MVHCISMSMVWIKALLRPMFLLACTVSLTCMAKLHKQLSWMAVVSIINEINSRCYSLRNFYSPPSDPNSSNAQELVGRSCAEDELRFNVLHGKNSTISPSGKTAARPNAVAEFNDAIVMSSRPLRDNELFEVSIDKMVDRWSGSIEAGELH